MESSILSSKKFTKTRLLNQCAKQNYILLSFGEKNCLPCEWPACKTNQGMSYGWCYFCCHVWYSHEESGKRFGSSNLELHQPYVDWWVHSQQKKNASNNKLFENMNPRQENVKLIAKTNPTKFINTAINVNPEVPWQQNVNLGNLGNFQPFKTHLRGELLNWAFKIAF